MRIELQMNKFFIDSEKRRRSGRIYILESEEGKRESGERDWKKIFCR